MQRFDISASSGAHNTNILTVNILVASSIIASISSQTNTMFEFTILGFDVRFILGLILGLSIGRIRKFFSRLQEFILKVTFGNKAPQKPPGQVAPSFLRLSLLVLISTTGIISSRFGSVHLHNFDFGKSSLSTDFFWLSLSRNQDSEGGNLVDCYVNGFGRNHSCASFSSSCSRPLYLLGRSEALVCTGIFVGLYSKNSQAQRSYLS